MSNLSDRGTLRGTLQRNSGNYNDLINKPAINEHTLIGNQSGHALGLANEEDIVNVEANPLGPATSDLHKILVDDTIYAIPDVVVYGLASGAIASFDDGGNNKPLKSLKVAINPVQEGSGTPSPQNVRPLHGWTGANAVVDGSFTDLITALKNVTSYDQYFRKVEIQGEPYKDYYINSNSPSTETEVTFIICAAEDTASTLNYGVFNGTELHITTKTSGKIAIYYRWARGASSSITLTTVNDFVNGTYYLQITEKSTDGQRLGTTYPITWSETGTVYGGQLELSDYVWSAERTYKKVDLGTLNWTKHSSGKFFYTSLSDAKFETGGSYTADAISSDYIVTTPLKVASQDYSFAIGTYYIGNCTLYVGDSRYLSGTAREFKQAMDGVQLVYALATPTPITLDSPLPNIRTLLGNNNIWSDTGDILECVYQRDLNIAINKALSQ